MAADRVAAVFVGLLVGVLAGGCPAPSSAPAPTAPPPANACAAYMPWPRSHAVCLTRAVVSVVDAKEAIALCDQGAAVGCRHAWAVAHAGGAAARPIDELLAVCGPDADCAMEVFELVPSADTPTRLRLCADHAGAYLDDCVGHAMERWWHRGPTASDVAVIVEGEWAVPETVGSWVAVAVECAGVGTCGVRPVLAVTCERRRVAIRAEAFGCRRMAVRGR